MNDVHKVVQLTEVRKRFGETVALDGCSLTIRPGQVHAIVGENGSGKSTLAKVISGVIRPDSGTVSIFGHTPTSPIEAISLGVATIFQEVLIAEHLSVADNIFAGSDGLFRRSRSKADARAQSAQLIKRFAGLDINPDTLVRHLPLSVRQWIVIARALVAKPRVLVLDESSAALDLDATARLHTEIRALRDAGCCVVIVTHRIAELIRITDRATVLRDGKVVGELVGPQITEQNLLSLMSPKVADADSSTLKTGGGRRQTGVALSGQELCVAQGARTFDLALNRGEILGVTGLDGQGQATFLRIAAGILHPFQGTLLMGSGKEATRVSGVADAISRGIAYVSGDRAREGIFPNLSIFENFAMGLYRQKFGASGWIRLEPLQAAFEAERRRLAIRMGSATNRITSLSGGNQQKVLIGRALALQPQIIVLDDPARGVDVGTKRELYAQLKAFAASGGAVLYLSSEIEEFFDFADRVLVFRDGTVFSEVAAENMSEHRLLAAMFGQTDPSHLTFAGEAVA